MLRFNEILADARKLVMGLSFFPLGIMVLSHDAHLQVPSGQGDARHSRVTRRAMKCSRPFQFLGVQVLLFLGAANMDPAVYKDAQLFRQVR